MPASASRQFRSFSRDRRIPRWRIWSKVTKHTAIPTYTVLVTSTVGCLLNLIDVGSGLRIGMINTAGAKLDSGPFRLPGIWDILVNIFSLVYVLIATFSVFGFRSTM
ncbi:hypothetical protein EYZ11_006690 [Aspergillus tanneri]|uniref:Uncharacterized protein n=1 Tax=Aspergillus tanneri TaxID=1220188 RepID=A0A4S3JHB0_9EURO|nr:hypothetical protein EYZ11_006690 [Aspergillus tanneri]